MSILNEVVMGNCSEVYHYFLNMLRYLKKNPNDNAEKSRIRADILDTGNNEQITICVLSHQRLRDLNMELMEYLYL